MIGGNIMSKRTISYNTTLGFNIEDRVLWKGGKTEKKVIIGFSIDINNELLAHLVCQDIYEEWSPRNVKTLGEAYKNDFFPSHSYRVEVKLLYDYNTDNLKVPLCFDDTKGESYLEYPDPKETPRRDDIKTVEDIRQFQNKGENF